jgi:hypothetical protein
MRVSGGVSGRLASGIAILDRWVSAQVAYCASYQASNVQSLRTPILEYLGYKFKSCLKHHQSTVTTLIALPVLTPDRYYVPPINHRISRE